MNPTSHQKARLARHILLAVLVASFVLNLVPFWWGLPSFQGWAFDEIRPIDPDRPSWPAKYPPLHRHVLSSSLLPLDALRAVGLISLDAKQLYMASFYMSRLVSVLMATALVYLIYRSARTMFPRGPSIAAAATVACMPPFLYYAKTANLDVPYLFWFTASLLFYLKALQRARLRDWALTAGLAALAICTKDQAYGLYLASPLVLLATLYHRADSAIPGRERIARTLRDRRVWIPLLVVLGVTAIVYNLVLGSGELWQHVRAALGPRTFAVETPTPTSHFGRLVLAGRQVAFSMSLPLALLAAAGFVTTAFSRRLEATALTLMIGGYYVGFILVLPYQNVRYLLPAALIGSVFVAGALSSAWTAKRGVLLRLLLIPIFGFALARGLWLEASMLFDSRYEIERWLASKGGADQTIGFGRQIMMPRGVTAFSFEHLIAQGCDFLDTHAPRHVVVSTPDLRGERELNMLRRLEQEDFNYREIFRHRTALPFDVDLDRALLSNLDKVNPEVVVFAREDRHCIDGLNLRSYLEKLRESRDPLLRSDLESEISQRDLSGRMRVPGSAQALAVGLHFDRWTRGSQTAAILACNGSDKRVAPVVTLSCLAPQGTYPVTAYLDDGRRRQPFEFRGPGTVRAAASGIASGKCRLILVWSDAAWIGQTGERRLGVNVNRVDYRDRQAKR